MFENTFQGPGAGTYTNHTIEILLMLLVAFLLGLLLGYILWYKWQKLYNELNAEHNRLKALHLELEKEHVSLKYQHEQSEKDNVSLRTKVMSLEGDVTGLRFRLDKCESDMAVAMSSASADAGVLAASAAPILMATTLAPEMVSTDDLKIIEGIGPKIEQLCHGIGVRTFAELASTPVERLQQMLDEAGTAYRTADPATWPHQAQLAAEGKWDELKTYQNFLIGGKTPGA